MLCCAELLSRVRLFVAPWTVAHQAPLSMGFTRQEYWSGLPCPPPGESSQPRNQTQVSNPGLPHCRQILSCLSHQRRLREVINTDKVKFNCLLSCETHHDGELLKKHCRNNFYTIMYVKLILVEVPKLI